MEETVESAKVEPAANATARPAIGARAWPWLRALAAAAVIAVIVMFGLRQFNEKVQLVKPVQYIGHSDEAGYALMGASLSQGRGIQVDYVSTFFIPYAPDITHREDHWPPFMGYSIAPCFYFLGKEAWVARLPAMFYASIGLPLATALLAYALSRRGYVALVAGLVMMATPEIYLASLRTLSDGATAMLLAAFCASVILARRQPWMLALAGIFAAGAFYAKESELWLLGIYPVLAILCCGFRVFKQQWFHVGYLATLFLLSPFAYANWREYGNPLFTTQTYVSSFYGFEDWDAGYYAPYWGIDLPKVSDRWNRHPNYELMSRAQLGDVAQYLLAGGSDGRDVWNDFGPRGIEARDWLAGEGRPASRNNRGRDFPAQWDPKLGIHVT